LARDHPKPAALSHNACSPPDKRRPARRTYDHEGSAKDVTRTGRWAGRGYRANDARRLETHHRHHQPARFLATPTASDTSSMDRRIAGTFSRLRQYGDTLGLVLRPGVKRYGIRRSCVGAFAEFNTCPWSLVFAGTDRAKTSTGLCLHCCCRCSVPSSFFVLSFSSFSTFPPKVSPVIPLSRQERST